MQEELSRLTVKQMQQFLRWCDNPTAGPKDRLLTSMQALPAVAQDRALKYYGIRPCNHPPTRMYSGMCDEFDPAEQRMRPLMWVFCCDCGTHLGDYWLDKPKPTKRSNT